LSRRLLPKSYYWDVGYGPIKEFQKAI
jgi:hypothetical protein